MLNNKGIRLLVAVAGLVLAARDARAAYDGATTDVMLQAFRWDSHDSPGGWWNIVGQNAGAIADAGFTVVWLPPPMMTGDTQGYLPTQWYNLSSHYGNQDALTGAIGALHGKQLKVLADVVINHRNGCTNWGDFCNPSFPDNRYAVARNDEWGQGLGAWDTGDGYDAGRDLDHTNGDVQGAIKAWLGWLKNGIGFDGWRYDYSRGYGASFVGIYNDATGPYFSVGELWPDIPGDQYNASYPNTNWHRQKLMDWINGTGNKSALFDFTTKWQLQLATANGEYWRLGAVPGAIGWWPARSVTFLDNHDTGPTPAGQGRWAFQGDKVEQGYAYILLHPGVPTVWWPHYFDWGSDLRGKIKFLIGIRREKGVTSTSGVSVQASDSSQYAAIVNGNVAVKIGTGGWTPGGGWTFRGSGNQWAVWTR